MPGMPPALPVSVRLSHSGTTAELTRDELTDDGVVLSIDGAEQSHVELGDPEFLLHDYIRRMRAVLTACDPAVGDVLHLGAGALTLPRWMAHWQPESHHTVVDIEPELVDFVLWHLPMEPAPENVVADAVGVLTPGGALADRRFDVIIVDLFNSSKAPAALTSPEFFTAVWDALGPRGLMLVNFGDEADMSFARTLTSALLQSADDDDAGLPGTQLRSAQQLPGAQQLPSAQQLLSAPADVLAGRAEGNLVFAAARRGFAQAQLDQIWAAGPHPGDVLTGEDLRRWCTAAQ